MNIFPDETPCLRCVFPEIPREANKSLGFEKCDKWGALGSVVGIIASIQTTEVIKYLIDSTNIMKNTMLYYDSKQVLLSKLKIKRNEYCSICSK